MISDIPSALANPGGIGSSLGLSTPVDNSATKTDVALQFEQMLWAEMLSHAGLEDALTKNGGEAVAAFSRFVVESIAADIAEKHPLGLSDAAAGDVEINQ